MKLSVTVKAASKRESVEIQPDGSCRIFVKAPPVEGKANDAVISALAKHFSVPKSDVVILHGNHGKKKLVEIVGK